MKITKNFYLGEFTWSDTAARMGREVVVPAKVLPMIERVAEDFLQPLRDRLTEQYKKDMPLVISSGYRPRWLNEAVGGASSSDHMKGLAVDFHCPHITPYELACFIAARIDRLPVDKLILEFHSWVHVSVAPSGSTPMRKVMTAIKRPDPKTAKLKTYYKAGIVGKESE